MRNTNEVLSKGFTLMEVMIVIVVLGVLAGLAVPTYQNAIEHTAVREAETNLKTIYTAEKIYNVNHGTYWGPGSGVTLGDGSANDINQQLNIELTVPSQYYSITSIAAGTTGDIATSFTATATRIGTGTIGSGGAIQGTKFATIDEKGTYTDPDGVVSS